MSGVNRITMISVGMMLSIMFQISISNAATFQVGGASGWGFALNGWPNGQKFKVGDVIEFKYPTGVHNVVIVNKAGFDNCDVTGGKVLSSGDDKVTLTSGTSYYICGIGKHCANGVKASVTAN